LFADLERALPNRGVNRHHPQNALGGVPQQTGIQEIFRVDGAIQGQRTPDMLAIERHPEFRREDGQMSHQDRQVVAPDHARV
jgi:hypothetical protein